MDYSYSTGTYNYFKVINSIGIGAIVEANATAVSNTNYINLPASALDVSNDYQPDLSRSRNIYSMGKSGIFMADKNNTKHHIYTGGNVVSATHVYRGTNANDQLYYIVSLDMDGTLNVYNAVSDTTAPKCTATSDTFVTYIDLTFDKILDESSFNKSDFTYTDNAVTVDFLMAITRNPTSTVIRITPSTACASASCKVSTSSNIKDLIGNAHVSNSYIFTGA